MTNETKEAASEQGNQADGELNDMKKNGKANQFSFKELFVFIILIFSFWPLILKAIFACGAELEINLTKDDSSALADIFSPLGVLFAGCGVAATFILLWNDRRNSEKQQQLLREQNNLLKYEKIRETVREAINNSNSHDFAKTIQGLLIETCNALNEDPWDISFGSVKQQSYYRKALRKWKNETSKYSHVAISLLYSHHMIYDNTYEDELPLTDGLQMLFALHVDRDTEDAIVAVLYRHLSEKGKLKAFFDLHSSRGKWMDSFKKRLRKTIRQQCASGTHSRSKNQDYNKEKEDKLYAAVLEILAS